MKLYHGTTEEVARQALSEGLKPRGDQPGNWTDHPSRHDLVYLTTAYAPYFASNATTVLGPDVLLPWGFVEVDTDLLSEDGFLPDEDFMEQASRTSLSPEELAEVLPELAGLGELEDHQERTQWWRDNLERWAHFWELSLSRLGNCAHAGPIPASAVSRVAVYDPDSNPSITLRAMDPCISIMNYAICGAQYRSLTEWFLGGDGEGVFADRFLDEALTKSEQARRFLVEQFGEPGIIEHIEEKRHQIAQALAMRDGLTIYTQEGAQK